MYDLKKICWETSDFKKNLMETLVRLLWRAADSVDKAPHLPRTQAPLPPHAQNTLWNPPNTIQCENAATGIRNFG